MKTVTLKQVGYLITGTSDLTLWGEGNASITMSPFTVNKISEIKDKINDAGFGVQSINGAICNIWYLFENDYREYWKEIIIGQVSDNTIENHYNN